MSKGKTLLGAGVAAAATVLAVVASSAPAHAADDMVYTTDGNGVVRGSMTFYDNGDQFRVTDLEADAHGVRGWLMSAGGTVLETVYNGKGSGNWTYFYYDIAVGKDYVLRVCTTKTATGPHLYCDTEVIRDTDSPD